MKEPIVYLNGDFVPASRAAIKIYDLGIILGATLTEMTRTFAHAPFRLDDHLDRLFRSCKYTRIQPQLTRNDMREKTLELIETNRELIGPEADLGIVHFITAGENEIYAGSAAGSVRLTPTVCIHSFPLPFRVWRHLFEAGAHVVTPSVRHVPPQCLDPKSKNRSRLHWWLADQQTHAVDPEAITLLLDLDGNVTECAGSNFVIVVDRTIYSPTTRNILQGVSLLTVKELAADLGLHWIEKDLQPYDVANADEAWLTTTPYCIAPCTKFNNVPVGSGKPGPLYRDMIAAWSNRVGLDIEKQILME